MSGLSRRGFMRTAAVLAAAWGLPIDVVAAQIATEPGPAEVTSTLVGTIRMDSPSPRGYRRLLRRAGEPYVVREDLLGDPPAPSRANTRRSLLYLGHLSDIHVVDAQSPARVEPAQMLMQNVTTGAGCRPQETLCVYVLDQMVRAMNAAMSSPVTGAPMAVAVVTGDSADSHAHTELRWYIDTLDGQTVNPNSGKTKVYEGVQAWGEAKYAYHPDDPSGDVYGERGYPAFAGMLEAAVGTDLDTVGIKVPWLTLYGNHDTIFMGLLPVSWMQEQAARGGRKASTAGPFFASIYGAGVSGDLATRQAWSLGWDRIRGVPGVRAVTRDPDRRIYDRLEFMKEHFDTTETPGPAGHGFTQANVADGTTWWARDVAPRIRLVGLDSCNVTQGADGSIPEAEWRWLEAELESVSSRSYDSSGEPTTRSVTDQLVIVSSHHTSWTMDNTIQPELGPTTRLHTGDELVELLARFPNVILWINGHTHYNRIVAHASPHLGERGGFWEVNTASCIDWGQQQRLVEIVDNRDGTISIFATVLDHEGTVRPSARDYTPRVLAGISRELAANHWMVVPEIHLGSRADRNCELPLKAPFDLAVLTDAELEQFHLQTRARLVAP
ncbi:MAG: TIGR03767 family metallophosphoesterase [Acidimicrobiia bacterium]|nr:TIGR03767 family metallophosphoesterase [Acidimicrobiia bacterium]